MFVVCETNATSSCKMFAQLQRVYVTDESSAPPAATAIDNSNKENGGSIGEVCVGVGCKLGRVNF